MLRVNQEEEVMKTAPLINVNSRVDDGNLLIEETGLFHAELDDEIMVPGILQEQRLDRRWWWYITKSRKLYIILLLLVTISASGVAVVFQYRRHDNNAAMVTGQVKSGYLNENYGSNKDDLDNYLSRQSNRMAQRSYSRVEPPEEIGYFNIYFREPNSYGHRRALRRVRFPVARYSRRRFPLVGPFINFRLSIPIFVDPSTGQTIIHSSRGSTYIIPPLINVYGNIFSIGELVSSGYASFINTGIGMVGNQDFGTLFRPGPLMGPGIPRINSMRGGFMGGVRTGYRSFFPRKFSKTPAYDAYPDYESQDEDNYQSPSYSYDKYYKKRPESIYKEPTCSDGVKNQYEILVDCGGPCSGKNTCADGFSCINGPDCISGVCKFGSCQVTASSCSDRQMNGDETDQDCGGACQACANGLKCIVNADCDSGSCQSGKCAQKPATCFDSQQSGDESDKDCGGVCQACAIGLKCVVNADCDSGSCQSGKCAQKPATCFDSQQDGDEIDQDCGGACQACAIGLRCVVNADCVSGSCQSGKCAQKPATCFDSQQDGDETDLDCGGACQACAIGLKCVVNADCVSGSCQSGKCAQKSATCFDSQQNGDETDQDCGGACQACVNGLKCFADSDCIGMVCLVGICNDYPVTIITTTIKTSDVSTTITTTAPTTTMITDIPTTTITTDTPTTTITTDTPTSTITTDTPTTTITTDTPTTTITTDTPTTTITTDTLTTTITTDTPTTTITTDTPTTTAATFTTMTGFGGGGQPFSNIQPSLVLIQTVPSDYLAIRTFAGNYASGGIPTADGRLLSIDSNQDAFNILGTTYGGDGVSNFALPNLQGVPIISLGQGNGLSSYTLGQQSGSQAVTLGINQMPTHTHTIPDSTDSTGMAGASQPFNNLQPSLSMLYIIATQGIFPSRSRRSLLNYMIAQIIPFAGGTVPTGWAMADGSTLFVAQNSELFSILGTTYGGDGQTTFQLPDLRGRVAVGVGLQTTLGEAGGTEYVTLLEANLPPHQHSLIGSKYSATATANTGAQQPIDTRRPFLGITYIIALEGIFPSRDGGSIDSTGSETILGEIVAFAGDFAPDGWAMADGQLLPVNQNQALFGLLGTNYGGNGQTNFALPYLRDRTIVSSGGNFVIGQTFGTSNMTLTTNQIPSHAHTLP